MVSTRHKKYRTPERKVKCESSDTESVADRVKKWRRSTSVLKYGGYTTVASVRRIKNEIFADMPKLRNERTWRQPEVKKDEDIPMPILTKEVQKNIVRPIKTRLSPVPSTSKEVQQKLVKTINTRLSPVPTSDLNMDLETTNINVEKKLVLPIRIRLSPIPTSSQEVQKKLVFRFKTRQSLVPTDSHLGFNRPSSSMAPAIEPNDLDLEQETTHISTDDVERKPILPIKFRLPQIPTPSKGVPKKIVLHIKTRQSPVSTNRDMYFNPPSSSMAPNLVLPIKMRLSPVPTGHSSELNVNSRAFPICPKIEIMDDEMEFNHQPPSPSPNSVAPINEPTEFDVNQTAHINTDVLEAVNFVRNQANLEEIPGFLDFQQEVTEMGLI